MTRDFIYTLTDSDDMVVDTGTVAASTIGEALAVAQERCDSGWVDCRVYDITERW